MVYRTRLLVLTPTLRAFWFFFVLIQMNFSQWGVLGKRIVVWCLPKIFIITSSETSRKTCQYNFFFIKNLFPRNKPEWTVFVWTTPFKNYRRNAISTLIIYRFALQTKPQSQRRKKQEFHTPHRPYSLVCNNLFETSTSQHDILSVELIEM